MKNKNNLRKLTTGLLLLAILVFSACGGSSNPSQNTQSTTNEEAKKVEKQVEAIKKYNTGIGPIEKVEIGDLDAALSVKGKGIYELKCQSCHRLEGERLVGPSFKGVTERRTPEWVMNMVMNTEAMLNEDADAKSLLELCLVRMPNQNVAEPDARAIVEYLRDIDGHKKTWTE
jgi:cytochrome c2